VPFGSYLVTLKADTSENRLAKGRHEILLGENQLKEAAEHDKEVKPIEQRDKVSLKYQGIHLEEHLNSEEYNEEEVGDLLEIVPLRLTIVFCGKEKGVQKYKEDYEPEHGLSK
jgi:hypothetical protein